MSLTHFNDKGRPTMVDVSAKDITHRVAIAGGWISMKPETLKTVQEGRAKKGDVLATAQIGGIMGGKQTSALIPMCHNIMISALDLDFTFDEERSRINIVATAKTDSQTGIEMEALTAVSTAALTVYDMCKAVDKTMVIGGIRLLEKRGGKSGTYIREEDE